MGVRREKMYKLDDHVACAVAGITGALHQGCHHADALHQVCQVALSDTACMPTSLYSHDCTVFIAV